MRNSLKYQMRVISTIIVLVFVFLFRSQPANGQRVSIDTLVWNSTRAVDQINPDTALYSCQFITRGSQSLDWVQRGGARISHYIVNGVDGTWPDMTMDGQVVYHVTLNSYSGKFTLVKSGGQLTVHMSISDSGQGPPMDYLFYISSITPGQ